MNPIQSAIIMSVLILVGVAGCAELGFYLGRRKQSRQPDHEPDSSPAIDAAVFALLGLLLAFAFGTAVSRLDTRRQLITQETNAIGTALLRLEMLPAASQSSMKKLVREYVAVRLMTFREIPDSAAYAQDLQRASQLQTEIWKEAVAMLPRDGAQDAVVSLLESLNEMFDAATARTLASAAHLPSLIIVLLVGVALLSGLVAGRSMARHPQRSVFHIYTYSTVLAISLYTIIDLDHPRHGLIRVDASDRALIQLHESLQSATNDSMAR